MEDVFKFVQIYKINLKMVVYVNHIVWLVPIEDVHHAQLTQDLLLIELDVFVWKVLLMMGSSVCQLYLNVLKEWKELVINVFVKMDILWKLESVNLFQNAQLELNGIKINLHVNVQLLVSI